MQKHLQLVKEQRSRLEALALFRAPWMEKGRHSVAQALQQEQPPPSKARTRRGALKDPMVHARVSWPQAVTCVHSWSREDRAP